MSSEPGIESQSQPGVTTDARECGRPIAETELIVPTAVNTLIAEIRNII
jgi:hypothetical protein